jgi:hypothetical protein
MTIVPAAGQHGPGDARQFVGDRHHDLGARSTLTQMGPRSLPPVTVKRGCCQRRYTDRARHEQLYTVPGSPSPDHEVSLRWASKALGD